MPSSYRYFDGRKNEVLGRLRGLLEEEDPILLAIIFGSFVDMDCYRDVDIAVYTVGKDLKYLAELEARLEPEVGVPVDVVPIDEISTRFRYDVLTKAIVTVEKASGLYETLLNQTIDELIDLELAEGRKPPML